jgi:septal ring factor EnvC (AmiA/AmiB activator)
MIIFILYLVLCLLTGYFGKHKKFGFWGHFFCSLFLTPLIGLLLLCASDDLRERAEIQHELNHVSAKLKKRQSIEAELQHLTARLNQMPGLETKLENVTTQLHQMSAKLEEMRTKLEDAKNSG